jgi:excisionase family DNA binding protein
MTTSPPTLPKLLTVEQTAEWLNQSTQAVRNWIKRGRLKARRIGRRYLIDPADVLSVLDASAEEDPDAA